MTTIKEKAELFRALHRRGEPVVLANGWDVASARLVEDAGAKAVATTSAGVAWSLGAPDGDQVEREQALALIERVARAVKVPVTADIENGFAEKAEGVGETIRGVLAAGAVGVNIEDVIYTHAGVELRSVADQAERVAAAREAADAAGVALFINARVDIYLRAIGESAERLNTTATRAAAFIEAGADGIFVPGVVDTETIAALVEAIAAPINVLAGPGAPSIPELAALGVARVSLGSSVAAAAYAVVERAAREAFEEGTYTAIEGGLAYPRLNGLVAGS